MLYSDDIRYHTYYSTCFCLSVSRYVPYIGMVTILMNDYGIFGKGLLMPLGRISVAIKTRAIKQEKEQLHFS